MMRWTSLLAFAAVLCLGCNTQIQADQPQDWPQFRGADGTGAVPLAKPVDHFDLQAKHNVKWATPMPGPSAATPAVVGNRVFTTAGTNDTNRLLAMALDRNTGEILWQHDVADARQSKQRSRENNHAECSPAADQKQAYFLFGSGDLLAVSHDGKKNWHINLSEQFGKIEILWGYASSPLLIEDKLYVMILRRQPSMLLCIDTNTGEILWKQDRPTNAQGESPESYASPIAATIDGQKQVLVYGGDALTAHDPQTGKELWRYTEDINPTNNKMFRVISGPTQGLNGLIYFTTPRGEDLFAIEVKDNTPKRKWMTRNVDADVPCPVYTHDALFVLSGAKKTLFKINPETGEEIWSHRIETAGYFRCTPTLAGNNVYLITGDGDLFIANVAGDYRQISEIKLGGYPTRATIAVAGNDLYIRTGDQLLRVGP